MKKVTASALFCLIALMPVWSLAQSGDERVEINDVTPELKSNKRFTDLPVAEQQALLTEAEEVYQRCVSRKSYATYHDCGCLKARFVGIRMENPDTPQPLLLSRLSKICPNVPGIRKMAYNGCKNISISKGKRPEFCDCVADNVAEQYAEKPIARIEVYQKYNNRAFGKCSR